MLDLIKSQPGSEGKWFAAAKNAGFYDLAIDLILRSPADPHTLIRAAKEYSSTRTDFAISCGLSALHWISLGHGYEISGIDILTAYSAIIDAAKTGGIEENTIRIKIQELASGNTPGGQFIKMILKDRMK